MNSVLIFGTSKPLPSQANHGPVVDVDHVKHDASNEIAINDMNVKPTDHVGKE
jgi:hypothetical protein